MEIRESVSAAGRFVRDLIGGSRAKRYVIEVDGDHADAFDISGAKIVKAGRTETVQPHSFANRLTIFAPPPKQSQALDV